MKSRWFAPLLLAFVFSFVWIVNGIWLYLDDRPPLWDMATHMTFGLTYLAAFQRGRSWFEVLDVSHYYPPFYHWVLALFFWLFGRQPHVGILGNTGATALMLYSTYSLGRRFYGPSAGLLAAVLTVTYPMMSWTSREAWPDYWLTALTVWSVDWLFRTDGFRKLPSTLVFGLSAGLGSLAKWTFPVFLVGPLVCALKGIRGRLFHSWRQPLYLMVALVVCVLVALPWYAVNLGHLKAAYANVAADGIAESDPSGWTLPGLLYYIRAMLSYQLFAPLFLLFFYGVYRALRSEVQSEHAVCATWILLPWVLLLLLPNKDQRFILPALPAVALFSSHWVTVLHGHKRTFFLAACIALSLLLYVVVAFPVLPRPAKISVAREAYFSWRERSLLRSPGGYQERLKIWPAEWLLFSSDYLGILGPPNREDWKLMEILRDAQGRSEIPAHNRRIALIPDLQRLNEANLNLYAAVLGIRAEVMQVRRLQNPPEATFDGFDFVLVKDGHQGAELTTRQSAAIYTFLERHSDRFPRIAAYPLPDGTEAVLLGINRHGT